MKELVVCSGKGGTGKTSLSAAFAALAHNAVLADCDVDAADLHLVLAPEIQERHDYSGGRVAVIAQDRCDSCGTCFDLCRFDSISVTGDPDGGRRYHIDELSCEGCGVCVRFCPHDAIDYPEAIHGEWFRSDSRHGPLVHARLRPGAENSGKLVTYVRERAKELAESSGAEMILVDGPPGIGCPVTASITGASMVLAVTEPGVSGMHDLFRLEELVSHFRIPMAVCINKADLNEEMTAHIEDECRRRNVAVVGRVPFDSALTRAQLRGLSVIDDEPSAAADAVRDVWRRTRQLLDQTGGTK